MIAFRNFLFLDTSMLDDYLATITGYVVGGAINQVEVEKRGKGGKAGYKVVEGEITSEKSMETKRTLAITDAAKFQQLYELMEQDGLFTYLDSFDRETWDSVGRGDIVEAEITLRVPEAFTLSQVMNDLSPFLDLMELIGEDPFADPETRMAFEGFGKLAQWMENKPVPIVGESLGTPGYKFACMLPRKYLRCALTDLQGEATLFGKVKRIIREGSKYDLFSLFPAIGSSLPSLSKQQQIKVQKELAEKGLAEVVHGPAFLVTPLAIYQ